MRFFVRVDASLQIGTGHVYRCLTLAEDLKTQGNTVVFICRDFVGNLIDLVQQRGFEVIVLAKHLPESDSTPERTTKLKHADWLLATQAQDACATFEKLSPYKLNQKDWILVDHFALDSEWEKLIQSQTHCQIAVIDGQADRQHHCDVLLDPNVCAQNNKWAGLVPDNAKICGGWSMLPIAQAFRKAQSQAQIRDRLERILVAFGGVDEHNYTQLAVQTLIAMRAKSGYDGQVDVVVGKHYPYFAELNQLALTQNRIKLHRQSDQMASLILSADLAIGAGGTMAWERAWLYLPSLVTAIAPNQTQQVDCLEQLGIAEQIKSDLTAYSNNLYTALEAIQQAPQHLTAMSNRAKIAVQNTPLVVWSEIFQTIAQRKMA